MKKYYLYDKYDGDWDLVAEAFTLEEIRARWENWIAETDGEALLEVRDEDFNLVKLF